jgi:immune inhibitor A
MKKAFANILTMIVLLFSTTQIFAIPATPYPITITQPDGSVLKIHLRGDEFFNYKTTLDGYPLVPDANGMLTYAQLDINGHLTSTNIRASNIEKRSALEKSTISRLSTNFNFTKQLQANRSKRLAAPAAFKTIGKKDYPLTGSPKSIVILVNFSDVSFVTPNTNTAFTNLLNQNGYSTNGGTGSANNYFKDNSMGVFSPEFDVVGPFTLPGTMASYGKNDASGNDINPQQMVIDACTLAASQGGVDFSQYDTDKNGIVDNVFIYYAGYNEAEGGPANSVWPHRWSLNDNNTKFNGVSIYGYACTSELRGNSGSNMCGIGTFCHEFGHVLGLDDMYNTNNNYTYNTLSFWDIMDSGPYLNLGRTPCGYSSYERFFLNWLIPIELKTPRNYTLDTLATSNTTFLISQAGNHNLTLANDPTSPEYFLLENRQRKGWDYYLPGHGMLVTHIYYDASTWLSNTPNNDPKAMGVDIIEADGVASDANLSGDPFPGTSNVSSFSPTLRSGTVLPKPLTAITETKGKINFKFMGGSMTIVPPVAVDATDTTYTSFVANWEPVQSATGYYLTVYNTTDGESTLAEGFDKGLVASPDWTITASATSSSTVYSGITPPSLQFSNNNEFVETEQYPLPATKLSFYVHSLPDNTGNLSNCGFKVEGMNEQNVWFKIDSIPVTSTLKGIKSYPFTEAQDFVRFRFTYTKGLGYLTFDDVTTGFSKQLTYNLRESWITDTFDTINNMTPNTAYFYKVRASDKNSSYENITAFSNEISVKTLEYPSESKLKAKINNGNVTVYLPTIKYNLYIYNLLGQCVRIITPGSTTFEITNLPIHQAYILKSNSLVTKIAL